MKKFKIKDSNGKSYLIEAKTYKEALKRFKDAVDKRSFVLKRKPNSQGEYVVEAYRNGYRDTPYDYATLDYDDAYALLLSLARTFRLTVTRSASMFIADSKVGDSVKIKDVALQKGDWFTFRHEADNYSFRLYKVIDDRQLSTNGFTEAMMCEKYIGSYDFRKKKFIMTKEGRETVKYDDYLKNNAVKFNSSDEALNWIKRQVEIRNTNKYFDGNIDTYRNV